MASVAQLVSEFAHTLGDPNNKALREHIKLIVGQTRNEVIRRSFENHGYVDRVLVQRYKVSLTDVNDGELELPEGYEDVDVTKIKRTLQKVPRPVRLTNNLPFDRVSSVGFKTNREFPFIKETSARFRSAVPGLCTTPCYDYINGFIYIFPSDKALMINKIVIEAAFENPTIVEFRNGLITDEEIFNENNEWLIPEDMIGQIKEIIMKRGLLNNLHETDEIPNKIKFNQ